MREGAAAAAGEARRCAAMRQAGRLAGWVGPGRPVTASGVLRRADVPAAARLGLFAAPSGVRSAKDVVALHRVWLAAAGAGLITISQHQAQATPVGARWATAADDEVLDRWLAALAAALSSVFDPEPDADALDAARLVLITLATDPPTPICDLPATLTQLARSAGRPVARVLASGWRGVRDPVDDTVEVLRGFGTLSDDGQRCQVTPLGRWLLASTAAGSRAPREDSLEPVVADGQVCQLQIRLTDVKPPCWRRVLVPASATLGHLHDIIQVVMDWDDDHLHLFTVGHHHYGDPYFDAENDEDTLTLAAAFVTARATPRATARAAIRYVYDLGDTWRHDITLERVLDPDPGVTYPLCVAGRADAPVEDWSEGDERTPTPYDPEKINKLLASLPVGGEADVDTEHDEIDVIAIGCYNDSEKATALLTTPSHQVTRT